MIISSFISGTIREFQLRALSRFRELMSRYVLVARFPPRSAVRGRTRTHTNPRRTGSSADEVSPDELPVGVARQLVDEEHLARRLVPSEVIPGMVDQRVLVHDAPGRSTTKA